MTISEELALIESAKTGNKESTQKLIDNYANWLNSFLRKYHGEWRRDLQQQVLLGFIEAIHKFDTGKADCLKPIAFYYIKLHITNYHRTLPIVNFSHYRYAKASKVEDAYIRTEELFEHQCFENPNYDDALHHQQIKEQVRSVVASLGEIDQYIVENTIMRDDIKDSSVGERFNFTRQAVYDRRKRIIKKLKKKLTPVWNNLTIYA